MMHKSNTAGECLVTTSKIIWLSCWSDKIRILKIYRLWFSKNFVPSIYSYLLYAWKDDIKNHPCKIFKIRQTRKPTN